MVYYDYDENEVFARNILYFVYDFFNFSDFVEKRNNLFLLAKLFVIDLPIEEDAPKTIIFIYLDITKVRFLHFHNFCILLSHEEVKE